jgi:LL-diaminopimelate aminotransferase
MNSFSTMFFASLNQQIAAMQASGCDVIRLDVGSPDLPPAPAIIRALAQSAANPDRHGYTSHLGTPALRRAWAELYRREFEVDLDPDRQILPLLGSKEGIFHLSMALLEPGDLVLVPDPGYMTYLRGALFAGAEPYSVPLFAENGYLPDLDSIPPEVARRARLLWLNYPNNPTAATADLAFFAQAVNFARENDLLVCHDAAYAQVTFDGYRAPSILQVPGAAEVAVEFSTLSKSHNMAGWRTGAAVGNAEALNSLYTLKTNVDSGHFWPVWEAAVAAMTGEQSWIQKRNQVYQRRRDLVLPVLQMLGLPAPVPRASLYAWFEIPAGWTRDTAFGAEDTAGGASETFARALLEDAHVALTPGAVFGPAGEGYVRLALTAPEERLAEAMRRLAGWMHR